MTEQEPRGKAVSNKDTLKREKQIDQASADGDSAVEQIETEAAPEDDNSRAPEDDRSGAPIDTGWAWVVLAACVFEFIIYGGVMRSFGVFFLQYQMRFNASASETAVMSMIQNVVLSITALFVMTIGLKKFSSRASVFTGGTLTVTAYLITAFTTDIRVFYFAQGVLGGVGLAMIVPPMLAIIGEYFHKHRGLANSIFTAGGSVGGLIFAPVIVKLFEEYQYTGALLIISGLLMNIWVSALLMRPTENYSKTKMKFIDESTGITQEDKLLLKQDSDKVYFDSEHLTFDEVTFESDVFHSKNKSESTLMKHPHLKASNFTRMQSYDPGMLNQRPQGSHLFQRARSHSFGNRKRTMSEDNHRCGNQHTMNHSKNVLKGVIEAISRSQAALYTSGDGICGSYIDFNIPSTQECSKNNFAIKDIETSDTEIYYVGCCSNMKSCIFSVLCTVFDLGLLRNPVFLTFLLMAFFMMSGLLLVPVYVPTHAKDIGISNEKIGLLISLMAVIDLVSKLTMGVVADKQWIKRSTILVIATFILGTTSHLMRFVNSFPTMIIVAVIAGICCGQYMAMYAVLLMEVIGPEKFKSSLGFGTLVHGTSIAVFFPVAGLLRDVTGSYVATFHLLGGLAYLAGVLAFIIPGVNKLRKGKEAEEIKDPLNKL